MVSSKKDLLASCVSERLEKVISLSDGCSVKIQALNGKDRLIVVDPGRVFEMRVYHAISEGLIDPKLPPRELKKYIEDNSDCAQEIFADVLKLSGELTETEAEAKVDAEKK